MAAEAQMVRMPRQTYARRLVEVAAVAHFGARLYASSVLSKLLLTPLTWCMSENDVDLFWNPEPCQTLSPHVYGHTQRPVLLCFPEGHALCGVSQTMLLACGQHVSVASCCSFLIMCVSGESCAGDIGWLDIGPSLCIYVDMAWLDMLIWLGSISLVIDVWERLGSISTCY